MEGTKKICYDTYLVDVATRPGDIDNEWADAVVDEWMIIYKRFISEAENFIAQNGRERVEIILGHHSNTLRRFAIRFI